MSLPFPSPTDPLPSRAEVFLNYLDYFRFILVSKLEGLADDELRGSRLPSGWAPIALLKHLTHVELRWLVWGFAGRTVPTPWGDTRAGRWYVSADESLADLVEGLHVQAAISRSIVEEHELSDVGQPGERWDGADPATLERVLFHLVQEYARHLGQLDVVRELIDGVVGE
jgi:uncharacterized damage-inducible protein DinB